MIERLYRGYLSVVPTNHQLDQDLGTADAHRKS